MKKIITMSFILGALTTTLFATNIVFDEKTAVAKCLGCHGQNFEKKAMGNSLVVSEMSKEDIEKSLLGYQDGSYGRTMKGIMKGQVKDLTKEEVNLISEYIVSLNSDIKTALELPEVVVKPEVISSIAPDAIVKPAVSDVVFDSKVATAKCLGCHGQNFEKKALNNSLVVSEMSKEDIEKSLLGYQDGSYGRTMKGIMKGQVDGLGKTEIKWISEYIASLNK